MSPGATGDPTSNVSTMMHIIKGNVGTGILAMAHAFKNSGLLVGTIALPIMGVICIHCMHMLVRCQETLCAKLNLEFLDYEDVAEYSFREGPQKTRRFAKFIRMTVITFLFITQLGFCCAYSFFAAESLSNIVDGLFHKKIPTPLFLLALLPIMILMNMIRSLKSLSYLSTTANFLQISGLCYIFINLFQDLPPTSSAPAAGKLLDLPLFFGTAIYAFEGIGIILPIKKAMREPSAFGGSSGVLNTAMTIVTTLYIGMGFFGYLRYGDSVQGNIALNLPLGATNEVVRLMFAVAIFLSYPLQLYVPIAISWPVLSEKLNADPRTSRGKIMEIGFRTFMVTATFALAAAVPKLDLCISLVGAFSSSCLALIFPPLFETLVFWEGRKGRTTIGKSWWLSKNIFISLFGITGFLTGTYVSVLEIINAFFK